MRGGAVLTIGLGAAVGGVLFLSARALPRRQGAVSCPGGRFLVAPEDVPLLMFGDDGTEAVKVDNQGEVVLGDCGATRATIKAGERFTRVRARWPQCGAFTHVRLGAKIAVPACDALTGRLKARKTRTKRFRATRSMCGDGILDPSGGEACDISAPHGDYACPGACQPSGSVGACGCPSVTTTTSSTISTTTSSNPTTTTSEPSSSTTSTTTTTTESSSTTTTTASTLPPTTTSSTTSSTITSSTIETTTSTSPPTSTTTTSSTTTSLGCSPGQALCAGVCTDTATDLDNCGSCGHSCTNAHGSTSCAAGSCLPSCSSGWGSCDGSADNGCETSLTTSSDCGSCGVACDLANASESCSTGICTLTGCNAGFSDCDGNYATGCELNHDISANTCAGAEFVGSRCGDIACGFLCLSGSAQSFATRTGRTSRWFRARASECGTCCADIFARITLQVPDSVDYDLFVYSGCGPLIQSSTNGLGQTDQVTVTASNECAQVDSGFDYWVEVRYASGASCSSWTLTFEGTSCGS